MGINMKMYNELSYLRGKLKYQGKTMQGRAPLVCTDEALYQIALLCPKKVSDFASVPGIGEAFIENYAEAFLEVIRKYEQTPNEKALQMDIKTHDILKELEKKLVNINRRNRLLYMPKAANKYAVDLFDSNTDTLDILFGSKSSVVVCDTLNTTPETEKEQESKYKKFVHLLREVNKDLREKGQNDLYVGYPFVIGRMAGEDFDVRAPLALFPVTAERTSTQIKISLDETRDVLYNNTLVLAHYKFNGINNPLPLEEIEEISRESFMQNLISFYAENGIEFSTPNGSLCKFTEYKASEFPKFKSGELQIENCVVIGKYPIRENSIQKDFNSMLENNEINSLLNNLLLDSDSIDYDATTSQPELKLDDKDLKIQEHEMIYINDLNSSQEAVLTAIDSMDELVVQGPPGTGKSQVITSLISDFVSADKTVLMVSEKKTALDVVYSRLGNLSKYALIMDDISNKELFYSQLQKMVNLGHPVDKSIINLNEASNSIDDLIKKLEVIAKELYTPNDFGIEPYKLYRNSKKIDYTNEEEKNKFGLINSKLTEDVNEMDFITLDKVHKLFSDTNTTDKLEEYSQIIEAYPWLAKMNSNMTEYNLVTLDGKFKEIKADIEAMEDDNIIAKIFAKRKIFKKINEILQEYFMEKSKELRKLIFEQIDLIIESTNKYIRYQELKPLFDKLSPEELAYYKVLLNIKNNCEKTLNTINDEVFNQLLCVQIEKFEMLHRELFQDVSDFDNIIRNLSTAIAQKQKLTKAKLEEILSNEMYDMSISKRRGEILRVIESKRKWSVNKFINKFNFELFRSIKIWLLTPEVVSEILPLQPGIFDLVIFDEASQMFIEKGIPSILRAKKVVIAGDHKQLRPSNLGAGRIELDEENLGEDEEISAAIEEESLLDLARFKYRDVLLNFHYRSKYEELIAFSNYAFYNGRLYVSPNIVDSEIPPIEVHKIENGMWVNRENREEAKYIVEMLKKFFNERKADETIGIITFNITQRDLIDDLIDEECAKDPEFAAQVRTELERKKDGQDIGLFVKNIESVQGDERDVIIFSIGYAPNEQGRIVRNFGWLNQKGGENRLNVAISRSKQKVHIVTSINPSELKVEDVKNDGPRYLKKYLEYAFAVSNKDKVAAKQILLSLADEKQSSEVVRFDSNFENQVYDALVAAGFEVDTQVGIGGYSIDLAIKKDGNYILGIECDGKLYHSSKSARERDYHRQKYLESRGWKIHRIWSSNWWKNPALEISKIKAAVQTDTGDLH